MRTATATAAWAAALAVMSMHGPFTTAEAAPARHADPERPRPVYGKLRRRNGFNDSTETTGPSPLGRPDPSVPPILSSSSSDFADLSSSLSVPLTTSSSREKDRHRSGESAEPTASSHDPLDPLLSSLLFPSSDSSSSLPPHPAERTRSSKTHSATRDSNGLPSPTASSSFSSGILPGENHHTSQSSASSSGAIIVGHTTILHSTTGGTGARPAFQRLTKSVNGIFGSVLSSLPTITGTGGVPAILPSAKPNKSPLATGVSGPGTGRTDDSSIANPTSTSLSASSSGLPPSAGGTRHPLVIPANSVLTITGDGTSVIVPIPNATGGTSMASPAITGQPSTTTTQPPAVTTSSFSESETLHATPLHTSKSVEASFSASFSQATAVSTTSNDTVTPPSTSSVSTEPSSTVRPAATTASVQPQVSIVPTGTNSQTSLTLPSTWSFAPKATGKASPSSKGISIAASSALSSSPGISTRMPKLVQPAAGMPDPPSNFTLIQVGFNFGLNYPFVVGSPESAAQIFGYLPEGIAYGLGIATDQVLMNALMPYDTSQSLGYITTLAQTYIPSEFVSAMQLNLHAPASPIYLNPTGAVNALMNQINPTIPILPGASLDSGAASVSSNPAATTRVIEAQGAPIGGDSGTSHKVKGSTIGIGAGAVAGAAVYAVAMIYVARRYRQKVKGHRRISSVATAGEMTQRSSGGMGSFFMSGANGRTSPRSSPSSSAARGSRTSNGSSNGRSVREQGISAPLMSENSLGWN